MTTAQLIQPAENQSIVLENVSWETYERLLEETGEHRARLTYDNGSLEIMTLSLGHESFGRMLGRLIGTLTLELDIPLRSGGSTTLKRKLKRKGLEPDDCFWIQHEARMRGKTEFEIKSDPPPDLAVEIDISRSSLERLPIYAAVRVPEVWIWDGETLKVYHLMPSGKYRERNYSAAFPFLPLDKIVEFLRQSLEEENALIRSFAKWVRADLLPAYEAFKTQKPRRRNGKR